MATIGTAWQVSGLQAATPAQSIGQLSAASSTSGSIGTASAGYYFITEQGLNISYRLIPTYGYNLDHTLSLSGYAFATVPTAGTNQSVWNTRFIYQAEGWITKTKQFGAYAGSYQRPQTFMVQPQGAPDDGGDSGSYASTLTSGTLGPAGQVTTSSTYYDRRPWVTGDLEMNESVTQWNFFPSVSANPYLSEAQCASHTSSVEHTVNLFNSGKQAYVKFNSPHRSFYDAGVPTNQGESMAVPLQAGYKWGPYDPGAQTLAEVASFIDYVGQKMRTGHPYVPSMINHPYMDSYGNMVDLHAIPEYDVNRHSFV
tara:strand:- start:4549 stop:5484 length:936 start_codon:yes stop_codon:yes gene_type:complete